MKWRTRQACVLLPVFIVALMIAGIMVFAANPRVFTLGAASTQFPVSGTAALTETFKGFGAGDPLWKNWLQQILDTLNWMIQLIRSLILGRE